MSKSRRYPKNWKAIALEIKERAGWQCAKCRMQCLRPGDGLERSNLSERVAKTLQVHHADYTPENNRSENLIPLCAACHLSYHNRGQGNVSIGQLSLLD